jgi:hypothetical protein
MPGFKTPSILEVAHPQCFILSTKILTPIIEKLLIKKRNCDNVRLTPEEPQEDEFALFRVTTHSPVEKIVFPDKNTFFISPECDFMPSKQHFPVWRKTIETFYSKLSLQKRGRLVLKNPYHSMRISCLKQIFPQAKFIHIYRSPLKVIPSTIQMWDIDNELNCLRKGKNAPDLDLAISIYDTMLTSITHDFCTLPESDYCTIDYDNLVNSPEQTIHRALDSIGIPLSENQRWRLETFAESMKGYRTNTYTLSKKQIVLINSRLYHHIRNFKKEKL